jgi:hypothetical protein
LVCRRAGDRIKDRKTEGRGGNRIKDRKSSGDLSSNQERLTGSKGLLFVLAMIFKRKTDRRIVMALMAIIAVMAI